MLKHFSCVHLFVTLWAVIHQAPLSMKFSRQEYWGGSPCPPPGDLPNPRIKPSSLTSPALAGGVFTTSTTWEALSGVSSVVQLCPTLCEPMDCSTPGFPVHHQLWEPAQTHAHRGGDAIQPSHPLFSSCPQFLPASGSFPMSQLFTIGDQSIGASASSSVLPMYIQG